MIDFVQIKVEDINSIIVLGERHPEMVVVVVPLEKIWEFRKWLFANYIDPSRWPFIESPFQHPNYYLVGNQVIYDCHVQMLRNYNPGAGLVMIL